MAGRNDVNPDLDVFERARHDQRRELMELGRRAGAIPYFRVVESHAAPVVTMEGRDRLMLGSNNYLGLTEDLRVKQAAHDAIDQYGTALTGSRLQNGTIPLHRELEEELAAWYGTEDALVFTSGYLANLGAISALLRRGDAVVVDSLDHASILDGCNLSGARLYPYAHNRIDKLDTMLGRAAEQGGAALVVVNTVLSMEGGVIDLAAVVESCCKHGVRLLADEAHALGVLGARGTGLTELFGLEDQVDLRMGTFSKSLASCGGFIAGPADVIDYLRVSARAFLFTVSAVPAAVGAALQAIRICRSDEGPQLFARVLKNAARLRDGVRELGFRTVDDLEAPDGTEFLTPIVPLRVGDETETIVLWNALWELGLYANVAVYPAVPPGQALIRMSVMATHDDSHLEQALEILAEAKSTLPQVEQALAERVPGAEPAWR
ncbi:MAG: aminotransferase class I/II-fold pyridoxal phosphate-dependent enzyme [Actinomycetota bacterium]|nr:aminotransferase class I/II-fold pyridoxal phosphate-dependent enzyme [Actinomycetota bacterium]